MGGDNQKENLVKLTAEEHFVAHQLLVKIYPENDKLIFAANSMCRSNNGNRLNNKMYSWLRKKHSKAAAFVGKLNKDKILTKEHRENISKSLIGNDYGKYSKGVHRTYKNGHPFSGKKRPEHSEFMKKSNMIPPNMGGKTWEQKSLTCPHCSLSGGSANMKRYHFDKCKISGSISGIEF